MKEMKMAKMFEKAFCILVDRRIQIKATVRFHLTPVKMAIIKSIKHNKCWQGCGQRGALHMAGRTRNHYFKQNKPDSDKYHVSLCEPVCRTERERDRSWNKKRMLMWLSKPLFTLERWQTRETAPLKSALVKLWIY